MTIAIVLAVVAVALALTALAVALASAARLRTAIENGTFEDPRASRRVLPQAGAPVGEFEAKTLDGRTVSHRDLALNQQLVGFFSAGCVPCKDDLPNFLALEESLTGGMHKPIAVVNGEEEDDARAFARSFSDAFSVIVEIDPDARGSVSAALGVAAFPTYVMVEDGKVAAAANRIKDVIA